MSDHTNINLRQLCIGYFLYSTSIKILTLPVSLARGSGNLAWLSALCGALIEVVLVLIATLLLKKLKPTGKTFRVLCFVFLPILALEVGDTAHEIYQMAYTDLFTDLSLLIFVLTLIFLGLFFITRQPRSFFRAAEIIWLFFVFALILAVVPTLYQLHVTWPHLIKGNFGHVLPTTARYGLCFESATFIFAFGSETQKSQRELRKINLTALLCAVGCTLLNLLFIMVFGPLASHKSMALVELTTAAKFITGSGSLDWLLATAALSALVLRFGLQLVAIATLLKRGRGHHA